jgi:hypothetical protein
MVIAGKMMWDDIVNPNWIRASPSAVRPSMFPLSMPGVRIYVQVPQAYSANLAAGLKATYELR